MTPPPADRTAGIPSRSAPSRLEGTREQLGQLAAELRDRGVAVTLHMDPVSTDAATAILVVAESVAADLIVIGLRRRSPVGKLVLGSVSQDVLLRADCAVLAVKADADPSA